MKLALAAGVAVAGLAFSALAEELPRIDANADGFITRAEASAMAERMFRDLDTNDDNKLDDTDRAADQLFELRIDGEGDEDAQLHRHADNSDERVDRRVIIRRGAHESDEEIELPDLPPMPPRPPMAMMFISSNEEADRNGDGALSLQEFRDQQLRFFDAGDVNGDGRVRFAEPPEPPEAPMPPAPPHPPRTHN